MNETNFNDNLDQNIKKGNNNKIIIFITVILLVIILGCIIYLLFDKNQNGNESNETTTTTEVKKELTGKEIIDEYLKEVKNSTNLDEESYIKILDDSVDLLDFKCNSDNEQNSFITKNTNRKINYLCYIDENIDQGDNHRIKLTIDNNNEEIDDSEYLYYVSKSNIIQVWPGELNFGKIYIRDNNNWKEIGTPRKVQGSNEKGKISTIYGDNIDIRPYIKNNEINYIEYEDIDHDSLKGKCIWKKYNIDTNESRDIYSFNCFDNLQD